MATAAATKEKNPIAILRDQFVSRSNELAHVLPKHIPVERFQRVVLTAVQMNPELIACNRQSLWNACLKAAQDGLLPDGREGAIVPFKEQAQWMPMVAGLLKRFRNSGQFKSITANVVREGEQFEYWIDENGEHMKHTPGDGTGKPIKAYAMATTQADGTMIKVMTAKEIDQRRNSSRAKNSPLWNEWTDEAWMKTVLRNLHKRLPSSSDLDDLIRRDDELYSFETAQAQTPGRITDVSSALDSFSGSGKTSNPSSENEPAVNSKPASSSGPADNSKPASSSGPTVNSNPESSSEPDTPSNPTTESEADRAYERGVEAKKQGMARKAVPGEYRDPDKSHLAKSWWSGWDSV
jgi:recombination protein RecT